MKIIPLSEGSFTVDGSKKFVPFNLNEDEMTARNRGSLLVEIQPFVVITRNDIILLDTGLGLNDEQGQFHLYKNLQQNNINANDITQVVMSHLHKDHAGGLINPYTAHLAFENATYHIQKQELEYAMEKGASSYNLEILDLLRSADNIILSEEEKGVIGEGISYEVTGAHSKYHRVIWIKEDDEIVFLGQMMLPALTNENTLCG